MDMTACGTLQHILYPAALCFLNWLKVHGLIVSQVIFLEEFCTRGLIVCRSAAVGLGVWCVRYHDSNIFGVGCCAVEMPVLTDWVALLFVMQLLYQQDWLESEEYLLLYWCGSLTLTALIRSFSVARERRRLKSGVRLRWRVLCSDVTGSVPLHLHFAFWTGWNCRYINSGILVEEIFIRGFFYCRRLSQLVHCKANCDLSLVAGCCTVQ